MRCCLSWRIGSLAAVWVVSAASAADLPTVDGEPILAADLEAAQLRAGAGANADCPAVRAAAVDAFLLRRLAERRAREADEPAAEGTRGTWSRAVGRDERADYDRRQAEARRRLLSEFERRLLVDPSALRAYYERERDNHVRRPAVTIRFAYWPPPLTAEVRAEAAALLAGPGWAAGTSAQIREETIDPAAPGFRSDSPRGELYRHFEADAAERGPVVLELENGLFVAEVLERHAPVPMPFEEAAGWVARAWARRELERVLADERRAARLEGVGSSCPPGSGCRRCAGRP